MSFQLFGAQKNLATQVEISNKAKQSDFLGTNFLAFKKYEQTSLEKFKKAEGWEHMNGSMDLQTFTTKSFDAPIKETHFKIDDFFDKPGHYKFMYGPAKDGLANPVAAGVDYNIDYGGFGPQYNQTEKQLAQYIKKDASYDDRFNKLKAKEWSNGERPSDINPLFISNAVQRERRKGSVAERAEKYSAETYKKVLNPLFVNSKEKMAGGPKKIDKEKMDMLRKTRQELGAAGKLGADSVSEKLSEKMAGERLGMIYREQMDANKRARKPFAGGGFSAARPIPDPSEPYKSYGLQESMNWKKRENTMVFQMDGEPKCDGLMVDNECIPSKPNVCDGEGRVFIPDVGCVDKKQATGEKNQGVCLPGWTFKDGRCYAGKGLAM